jgi:energy-converting hydrogenase Eha subunit G
LTIFAQSLGEYGSLTSVVSAAMGSLFFFFQQKLTEVSQTTWVGVGGIVLLAIVLWGRRSARR